MDNPTPPADTLDTAPGTPNTEILNYADPSENTLIPPLVNTLQQYRSSCTFKILHGSDNLHTESHCSHVPGFHTSTMHILVPSVASFSIADVLEVIAKTVNINYHNVIQSPMHPDHNILEISPLKDEFLETGVTVFNTHLQALHPKREKDALWRVNILREPWALDRFFGPSLESILKSHSIELVQVRLDGIMVGQAFVPNKSVYAMVRMKPNTKLPTAVSVQNGMSNSSVKLSWVEQIEGCSSKQSSSPLPYLLNNST
ncbi:hypothetical protein DFQ27_009639 [Actinomortierella ambigua]|uniref:Uncharacterized protein n=1 Tax=Actinomortierella ambigua TaxID=1343610 RepID=A0A9P6TX81_9FUNG|nr:hypothetical protein DFQ27_009639 [Actinomortierella ambigua]